MPTFFLADIASKLGAECPDAAAQLEIHDVEALDEAGPGHISFLGNPKYARQCRETKASAILVEPDFSEPTNAIPIRVANPSLAFATVIEMLRPPEPRHEPGLHATAIIHPSALVGADAVIGPFVVIEAGAVIGARAQLDAGVFIGHDSRIGDDLHCYPRVSVRERSQLGNRVTLHNGVVVGSDGFGYELINGQHRKIPQVGHVQVDDDVEIGANTTIDRARFGRTWIQQGVKIDNLVQIAHNVVIGRGAVIVAQAGVSGSSKIGAYAILAGQVGVVGHVRVGNQAIVAAQSGVSKDVPDGVTVFGSPATPMREAKERIALTARLPKLLERVKALEQRIAALESGEKPNSH